MIKRGWFFARVLRGCDVALKATWQRHAGPRGAYAGPRCAYAAPYIGSYKPDIVYTYIYHYLYSLYNGYSAFRISEGFSNLLNRRVFINPTCFTNFFRVGLSPTQLSSFQATWLTEKRWSGGAQKICASIAWTRGPPINQSRTCLIKTGYNGHDWMRWNASWSDGRRFDAFYKRISWDQIWSVHSRSDGRAFIVMVRHYECIWTVDGAWNAPIGRFRPI